MTLKKMLSLLLALTLALGVLSPCGALLPARAVTPLYGEANLEQVTEPVIGNSYYLAANVAGKMYYFCHGTYSDTSPNSLLTTDDIHNDNVYKLTVESSKTIKEPVTDLDGYFQLGYTNPSNDFVRVQTLTTGTTVASGDGLKNRHTFFIDEVNGVKVLRKYGTNNNYILVFKYNETKKQWRILGVPEAELANEGVYPAMLLDVHTHSSGTEYGHNQSSHWHLCDCGAAMGMESEPHNYGQWSFNTENGTQSRACTVCGYKQTIYGTDDKLIPVEEPVIGQSYYLAANVAGTMYYFRHGTVTDTVPYSLVTTDNINHNWAFQLTLESSMETDEKFEGGFQLVYANPSTGTNSRIYCYDVKVDGDNRGVMDTGANSGVAYKNRHSFFVDEVNGVKVLRKYGNDNILVVKYDSTVKAWRMLGVPEAELANEGVYPAMLLDVHTHSSGTEYGHNQSGHWHLCDCGAAMESEPHNYGQWIYNTENGTQSRACTVCGYKQTIYGTDDKLIPVEEPVIGQSYYLAANVAGTMYYFRHGTVTDTLPYSLVTTDNINHNWAFQLTVESSMETSEKFDGGFQLVYTNPSSGAATRIYCYDVKTDGDNKNVMDTGVQSGTAYQNRNSFFIDEVNGVKVLRQWGNRNVLVVKYNSTVKAWRMLGVPEAELANEGVYPAMLLDVHTHSYGTEYEYDQNGHWHLCDCGTATELEPHNYVMDEALGYGVCVCGADLSNHECENTDGQWYQSEQGHYQLCNVCGEKMNEAAHTYGQWIFNTENGTQARACTVCGYKETLYGTGSKVIPVEAPAIGQSYYLAANVAGTIYYFRHGTVTDTVPYSLVTTDNINHNWAFQLTLESSMETDEKFEGGFQLVYTNPTSGAATRIYCYDVLKDEVVTGQTGVMDTGANSGVAYKNRHSFFADEVNGVKVLRKYGNNNVLVVKQLDQTVDGEITEAWRMLGVPESELANEGVYPVMLVNAHTHSYGTEYEHDQSSHWQQCDCGTVSELEPHSYGKWIYNLENGTRNRTCTVCGYNQAVYDDENSPAIGRSYYLAADVAGTMYYFRHGTISDTVPYSLVTTDNFNHNWVFSLTLESSMETDEKFEGGFQLVYTNPTSGAATRIYCYDVLKDEVVTGQTGVMDTGANSGVAYKNRHSFFADEVNGVKVLRKYGNNNVLVVKQLDQTVDGEITEAWRMLGVPEAELDNEGVYPVMLVRAYPRSVCNDAEGNAYSTLQEAVNAVAGKKNPVVTLNDNVTENITVSESVVLDLNNKTLTGNITLEDGAKLFGMDSATDRYGKSEYGKICGTITGNGTVEKTFQNTNSKKRYVAVHDEENNTWTFNRFYIGMQSITADVNSGDVGYKAIVGGNENVKNALDDNAFGFKVWVESHDDLALNPTLTKDNFVTGDTGTTMNLRIANQLKYINDLYVDGGMVAAPPEQDLKVNATVTIQFKDCDPLESLPYAFSIVQMYQALDAEFDFFTAKQQDSLVKLTQKFPVMRTWGLTNIIGAETPGTPRVVASNAKLEDLVIVANDQNRSSAIALAQQIKTAYGVSLPVRNAARFQGNGAIYVGTQDYNSYSGLRYSVTTAAESISIYVNGSGKSLTAAMEYLVSKVNGTAGYPYDLTAEYQGFCYDETVGDNRYEGLNMTLTSNTQKTLGSGVSRYTMQYKADGKSLKAYAVVVSADSPAKLKVVAAPWDETNSANNPVSLSTVRTYRQQLENQGDKVLAICNGGFFKRTGGSNLPCGAQIIDGTVLQAPSTANRQNSDNWFGVTTDGQYVISNTEGYNSTYQGSIQYAVSGGQVLMKNGVASFTAANAPAYRTCVGITENGDLILLCMEETPSYAMAIRAFMDLEMDVANILNLDGGGSTTLYTTGTSVLGYDICGDGLFPREVADAIAIVAG